MELRVPAISALGSRWGFRIDASGLERGRRAARSRADDRFDGCAGASAGGRRKRGTQKEGFGRSKGGFTTKIHLRTNGEGLPIAAEITGGEVSDYKGYDLVMDADAPDPKVLLGDRGFDSDYIRDDVEERGGVPVIPMRKNRKIQIPIDGFIYALRNRIERCINRLKNARRLATRYDKTAARYLAFIHIVSNRLWVRHFVNTAYGETFHKPANIVRSRIIFYYGIRSIPRPFSLIGTELDDHFGVTIRERVEKVNAYFKEQLLALLDQLGR